MSFCSEGFVLAMDAFDALGAPPKVIVEVGAFDGDEAISLKQRYPGARVIAFEACPLNYDRMITLIQGSGVEPVWSAVCDHNNGLDFWPNKPEDNARVSGTNLPPTASLKTERLNQVGIAAGFTDTPVKVPSVRLDDFCKGAGIGAIDIVQMDVQGAEAFVLRGLGSLRPRVLFLEVNETADFGHYSGGAPMKELRQLLTDMGYELRWDNNADAFYFLP